MGFDLHNLQTVQCGESLSLRIPTGWQGEAGANGYGWCFYEDGADTGTLWVDIMRFQAPENFEASGYDAKAMVENYVAEALAGDSSLVNEGIVDVAHGFLWTYRHETVEDGERLSNFRHIFFHFVDDQCTVTNFNFVLLASLIDDSEFHTLIETMDREIRAAEFWAGPAVLPMDIPLARFNFADMVVLELPETLRAYPKNDPDNRWYCSFEPDEIEARLWVMIRDWDLVDAKSHQLRSVGEDEYEEIARSYAQDGSKFFPIAGGVLAYSVHDDVEEGFEASSGDPSDWRKRALHNHVWEYFRFARETLRRVQLMLMLPFGRSETAQLQSLVKLIDREIRRAEFPDFAKRGEN